MAIKASIIKIYADADSSGKVEGSTKGLRYMIENEKSYNRKASY